MTSSFAFQASTRILTRNCIGPDRFESTSEFGFRNVRHRAPDRNAQDLSGFIQKNWLCVDGAYILSLSLSLCLCLCLSLSLSVLQVILIMISETPGSRSTTVFSTSATQQRGIRYSGIPRERHISQRLRDAWDSGPFDLFLVPRP
jgi:hypothetical protein